MIFVYVTSVEGFYLGFSSQGNSFSQPQLAFWRCQLDRLVQKIDQSGENGLFFFNKVKTMGCPKKKKKESNQDQEGMHRVSNLELCHWIGHPVLCGCLLNFPTWPLGFLLGTLKPPTLFSFYNIIIDKKFGKDIHRLVTRFALILLSV